MSLAAALVLLPWGSAVLLALLPRPALAARGNVLAAGLGFCIAALLVFGPDLAPGILHLDALNRPLLLLGGFIGATAAVFSLGVVHAEAFPPAASRAYHAAFQIFLGANHLALLSENLGVMWVAIEIATLSSVLMVAVHRTPAAIEAAWKFFVLAGVGIALALFGTIVLAMAAHPLLADPEAALSIRALRAVAARSDAGLLTLAMVLLLVGYGTKAGLAPLHSWLPDADAEGPTAISAVLSGLLLNAALHAILRVGGIISLNAVAIPMQPFLMGLGVTSLLLASLALWRRRDARRLFAWSSIEHIGIAAICFSIPGGAAAGLLHMIGHSLLKSAVFFAVGRAVLLKGSQKMADISGLVTSHPALGWGLLLGIAGLSGMPPFPLFVSELRLLLLAGGVMPWLLVPLCVGLLTAGIALVTAMQRLCLGPATPDVAPPEAPALAGAWTVLGPLWLHLVVAAVLGFGMPGPMGAVLAAAAGVIGR
ncbi:proton-conducting transporter membrane subunit [Humitalea sp. 24SJ18S-53]|uniref:proton-conducting transporter transmembrane domain-containing protein n=1 Tax=Humitalea sp. 24SJ18S-53 TaxID=3422307 RepID=UPI003D66DD94